MILSCPACPARYLVPAETFAEGPRQVRCARCQHSWLAEAVVEPPAAAAPVVQPETRTAETTEAVAKPAPAAPPPPISPTPTETKPIPAGSGLPALWRDPRLRKYRNIILVAAELLIVILLVWLIVDRQNITRQLPFMERAYNFLHLYIYHPGDGLSLSHVHSERRFEAGTNALFVSGQIHNDTKEVILLPRLSARAVGPDGKVIKNWIIDLPKASLVANDALEFQSSVEAPRGMIAEINLSFIEALNVE